MDHGPHVFLSGEAADRFAAGVGLEQVPNDFFILPERRRQLEEALAAGSAADPIKYGTIGAVAVDLDGNVAAATSTGGITAKRWGRVGDSPLIGAGTYADNRAAAVSATGSGEYFIRAVAAHQLAERVRLGGETLQQALDARARRHRGARRQGRTDRGRRRMARRRGASPPRRCIAAWPTRPAEPSRSIPKTPTVGQVAPQPLDLVGDPHALGLDEFGDRVAEAAVGQEMRAFGDDRLIAARDLVLALGAGLDSRRGR